MARIELEISYNKSINRETRILGVNDNLYYISNEMEQYKEGYTIKEIDPISGTIIFLNGEMIMNGDVVGDISERDMRRIQIRETIVSHFEKEEELFNMEIKNLSLFFIDEVAKYRQYDDISAYDLILKNKERLLDFKEPTRFIFSHSALREGWTIPMYFKYAH